MKFVSGGGGREEGREGEGGGEEERARDFVNNLNTAINYKFSQKCIMVPNTNILNSPYKYYTSRNTRLRSGSSRA